MRSAFLEVNFSDLYKYITSFNGMLRHVHQYAGNGLKINFCHVFKKRCKEMFGLALRCGKPADLSLQAYIILYITCRDTIEKLPACRSRFRLQMGSLEFYID